jgi:uncharacterized hydrophobic protein (TIGR00271 family)
MASFSEILKDNRFTPEVLPQFESKLFFEGERRQRYLVRFAVLMFFATVIATGGVIADSTATVIGAMLIAPLMTPILATTAALVMGDGKRAGQSFQLVVSGVIGAILVSMVLSLLTVKVISFSSNTQIVSRVQPSMVDLIVALAAGAAGAFAMSRDDVADSLPGVAISIALVPPLCVVGISLGNGQWDSAWGAFLLFLTNCLSILLAGGAVFALLRLEKASTHEMSQVDRRKAYRIVALGIVLVAIPLAATTFTVGRDSRAQLGVDKVAENWIEQFEENYVVDSVLVSNNIAKIVITGPEAPESITDLGLQIQDTVDQVTDVALRFVPSKQFNYSRGLPD